MTKSPFIIAGALLFWGWQTGWWWLGLPLAILAELPIYLSGYWELSLKERQRVADLCSAAIVLTTGYIYITQPPFGNAVILTMQLAPVLFFPLLATQIYGGLNGLELSVLFLSLRGNRPGGNELIDLRSIYLIVCLLAAGMLPPSNNIYYYLGLGLITLWMLWPIRRPNRIPFIWVLNFSLAIAMGLSIGIGLALLQNQLEEYIIAWLSDRYADDTDTDSTTTAIGDVGRLKLSEQVMLRVWPEIPLLASPLLLRSASFTNYANGTWVANHSKFNSLIYGTQGWILPGNAIPNNQAQIAMELENGNGILPLPNGSRFLWGLKGAQLSSNNFGTVKVAEGTDFANYIVDYGTSFTESPPQNFDLRIPVTERPILETIVTNLKLRTLKPSQTLDQVQNWFQHKFKYSLHLPTTPSGISPLTYFLTANRAGHCEYFATATVLLLRQAGIPARYVHGWSIQEYSDLEQAYIARARHAHAWALVWINGVWQDFDPTPSQWSRLEAENRPWWSNIQDLWSWARYRLATSKSEGQTNNWWLIFSLVILIVILIWRIAKRGRRIMNTRTEVAIETITETMFTPIEEALSARTRTRYKGETLLNWLRSLSAKDASDVTELLSLLHLYYKQRFDPLGINSQEISALQTGVEKWLKNQVVIK